jgi:hypothetical protein
MVQVQYPDWWIRGGGSPYPRGVQGSLCGELDGECSDAHSSVVIVREPQHRLNLSGGAETLIPSRLLFGLVPQALLDAYVFWQDESTSPRHSDPDLAPAPDGSYKRLRGYPADEEAEHMLTVEFLSIGSWESYMGAGGADGTSNTSRNPYILESSGYPGRSLRILRRSKQAVQSEFHQYRRVAQLIEALHLVSYPTARPQKAKDDKDDAEDGVKFKVDANVECDIEENGVFIPCVVCRVNDNGSYDLEFVGEFKWMGVQKDMDASAVQGRGMSARRAQGEGLWHWAGLSDSEDEDWRDAGSSDGGADDGDEEDDSAKQRLRFCDFDRLWTLLQAAGSEPLLLQCLESIGGRTSSRERAADTSSGGGRGGRGGSGGGQPLTSLRALQEVVSLQAQQARAADPRAAEEFDQGSSLADSAALFPYHQEEEAMVFLNMLYAPRRSRLFSVMQVLTRIEHVGHICPWVKCRSLQRIAAVGIQGAPYLCPDLDLVELPRLKLSFTLRPDHEGTLRLYSVDHVDLFISDERHAGHAGMLAGMPHSLLLSNVRGEAQVDDCAVLCCVVVTDA